MAPISYIEEQGKCVNQDYGLTQKLGEVNIDGVTTLGPFYVKIPHGVNSFNILWRLSHSYGTIEGSLPAMVIPTYHDETVYSKDGTRSVSYEEYYIINEGED